MDNQTDKNSVFSTEGMAGVENISRSEAAKREFGFELPAASVHLPSQGRVYPKDHPLHLAQTVDFRSMTPREEDILMTPTFLKKGTVVTELIKACILDKNIDVNTLITGDRNAIMIAIRSSGYGELYEPTYSCPKCETKNNLRINLNELKVKPLSTAPAAEGQNAFKFSLPVSKKTVTFKLATGKDEQELIAAAEAKKKRGITNISPISTRLLTAIIEVDGITDRGTIAKFVQYMPARDSLELRKFMDEVEPGVQTTIDFACSSCDHGEEIEMPFGLNFLYPNAK
jgi:hypothetical protein